MKKLLLIAFLLAGLTSCSDDNPDAIRDGVVLDTLEREDTNVVRPDVIIREDNTNVRDSTDKYGGPQRRIDH